MNRKNYTNEYLSALNVQKSNNNHVKNKEKKLVPVEKNPTSTFGGHINLIKSTLFNLLIYRCLFQIPIVVAKTF